MFAPLGKLQLALTKQLDVADFFEGPAHEPPPPPKIAAAVPALPRADVTLPTPCLRLFDAQSDVQKVAEQTHACAATLSDLAIADYRQLEPLVSPDTISGTETSCLDHGIRHRDQRACALADGPLSGCPR